MAEFAVLYRILRGRLYEKLPFLAYPLGIPDWRPEKVDGLATDGKTLWAEPAWLHQAVTEAETDGQRMLLHTILHCILGHPWSRRGREPERWSLACDLAAEFLASRLLEQPLRDEHLLRARYACPRGSSFSAAAIYNLLEGEFPVSPEELQAACRDDHRYWYQAQDSYRQKQMTGEGDGLSELWERQREKLRPRMQELPPKVGTGTAGKKLELDRPEAPDQNFAALLRQFSTVQENRHVNDTDFQYAWYAYGIEHCGGMPLIEPLEYSEERRLREMVMVIDTSASCSRGLTTFFLGAVQEILCREQLFFERFNLHILQCDCEVQQDSKVTTLEEFACYIDHLELFGGGGTDFRPAFHHIDKLVAQGEFSRLGGVLYFTDGYGVYPDEAPDYPVTFVMLQYRYDDIDLPSWAGKLVLEAPIPKGDERWI